MSDSPEKLCAKDFNFWCAVNSKPFRLAQHVWPDGSIEWDVEVFPGRPESTIAYGTGQANESVAAASAFAFAAGVEWGELWARDAGADESADVDAAQDDGTYDQSAEELLLAAAIAEPEPEPEDLPPTEPDWTESEDVEAEELEAEELEAEEAEPEELELELDDVESPDLAEPAAATVEELTTDEPPFDDEPFADDESYDEMAPEGYTQPPLTLLQPPPPHKATIEDEATLADNARVLETVLRNFKVRGEIMEVRQGPVVTLYEFEPLPGTKSSTVINLADDIARSMSVITTRIAVVPGRSVIGIELPNAVRESVYLREILDSPAFQMTSAHLALALGNDIGGQPVVVDLARMPHLLIAGTTGSGKSVGINAMILSLLYRLPPERCRMIMVDPKMLELSIYDGIPHLLAPVVTDPHKAVRALKWAVREMETRYRAMSLLGVRNIEGYNARLAEIAQSGQKVMHRVQVGFDRQAREPIYEEKPIDLTALPYIVVVVDEMADLMLVAGRDIEAAIQRLAQMARAAGIHLIMATQRPSVDVITGTIKANFPTRISFQVTSKIDSRTILGEAGAEQLVGQGDMLYMAGGGRIRRVHGAFVSDAEVEQVASHLRAQGEPEYLTSITDDDDDMVSSAMDEAAGITATGDDLYDQAVALVMRERKVSISFIQRHLQIGYNRSARMVERMEADGIVSSADHTGKREVIGGR